MTGPLPPAPLYPALIGADSVEAASSGETLESINPATGSTIGYFPRCGVAEVDRAVAAASEAATEWRRRDPHERAKLVLEIADLLEDRADEFATLDMEDNGSTLANFHLDVRISVEAMRYLANLALEVRGDTLPTAADRFNYTVREPFGVVARIIPFNHPIMFATIKLAAPLVTGNTVVVKPSEHTSLSALRLGQYLTDILPPGVVNIVPGLGAEVGDRLVTHPDIRRIAFIGSAENGRAILERAAADQLKTVTLELGGKNPLVAFGDADIDLVVEGAVRGMNLTWAGQSCGSTSRLIVHRSIHDEVVAKVAERFEALVVGLPDKDSTDVGAVVNQGQYDKVMRYVQLGVDEGAQLLVGGDHPDDPELRDGLFIRPALFDGVQPGSSLDQEEIFGPVLSVLTFDTYTEAMQIANGIRQGLTASVFTRDPAITHRFVNEIEAGYVWVNEVSRHILGTPFGGYKGSGLGREENLEELLSYTQLKNVHVRFA